MNMAAFEKETVVLENLRGNGSAYSFQKLFSIFFMSGHITLDWRLLLIHISNRTNKAFFKNIFHELIDCCVPRDAGRELLCP